MTLYVYIRIPFQTFVFFPLYIYIYIETLRKVSGVGFCRTIYLLFTLCMYPVSKERKRERYPLYPINMVIPVGRYMTHTLYASSLERKCSLSYNIVNPPDMTQSSNSIG